MGPEWASNENSCNDPRLLSGTPWAQVSLASGARGPRFESGRPDQRFVRDCLKLGAPLPTAALTQFSPGGASGRAAHGLAQPGRSTEFHGVPSGHLPEVRRDAASMQLLSSGESGGAGGLPLGRRFTFVTPAPAPRAPRGRLRPSRCRRGGLRGGGGRERPRRPARARARRAAPRGAVDGSRRRSAR